MVFPIKNRNGDVVAYSGRSIRPREKRRYQTTEDARCLEDPRTFLYGIEKAKTSRVLIVEGPTDVWNMGPGAVGTFGISWTPEQANILKEFDHRYIAFDPGVEEKRQAQRLAEWLSMFPGTTEVIEGLPTDPGGLSRSDRKKLRRLIR